MGVFTHVKSKKARRLSKQIRPYYQATLFAAVGILGMWSVMHYDPSSAIHSRFSKISHPDSTFARRQLEEDTFNSQESEVQCRLDDACRNNYTDEDSCNAVLECEWYIVLNTCQHTTTYCSNASKSRCDSECPTYNWTVYDLRSGMKTNDFTDYTVNYQGKCNGTESAPDIVCNCSGDEYIEVHDECANPIFGVPVTLGRENALHSIWILVLVIYGFIGIAIVCDTYFEPSLQIISDKLKLSPDVAGATFMAMGSSAPELFTSLSDNFIVQNNVGVGTIVGSALFNVLVIVALSAVVARPPKGQKMEKGGIHIDWRPVIRDVIFYAASIGCLIGFIIDESVYWWEALLMIIAYAIYIVFMTQNPKVMKACDKCKEKEKSKVAPVASVHVASAPAPAAKETNDAMTVANASDSEPDGPESKSAEHKKKTDPAVAKTVAVSGETKQGEKTDSKDLEKSTSEGDGAKEGDDDDDDDDDDWRVWPTAEEWKERSCGAQAWFIFVSPLHALFYITIPNCGNPNECLQSLYPLTFINCVLWMAILCALETTLVTWLGCWWGISAPVMGIVILAIGTSVPDAIASMIVARGGEGDMAIANAVGSNVFDILFGLGLPWLIADLVYRRTNSCGDLVGIFVDVDGIVGAALILYGTVLVYTIVLILSRWRLNKTVALVFFILYAVIITVLLLNEYCVGFTWKAYNNNCNY